MYDYPVRQIIQAIKYHNRLELIQPATRLLTDTLQDYYLDSPWPQAMIPVPLHFRRLRQRGYDQTLLLARELKKQLPIEAHIHLDTQILKRTKDTSPQQGRNAIARRTNIKQAFTLSSSPEYQHVALLDDVVTTSATVTEATRLLKKAGVNRVDIWTMARTPVLD